MDVLITLCANCALCSGGNKIIFQEFAAPNCAKIRELCLEFNIIAAKSEQAAFCQAEFHKLLFLFTVIRDQYLHSGSLIELKSETVLLTLIIQQQYEEARLFCALLEIGEEQLVFELVRIVTEEWVKILNNHRSHAVLDSCINKKLAKDKLLEICEDQNQER